MLTLRPAARKYESSHETLARTIVQYCGGGADESLARCFEYVALSVMVRNGDAHLKNSGLLSTTRQAARPRCRRSTTW